MGGGLFCASVANVLLVVSTVTDYWMQYRLAGIFARQGLWRYCWSGKCYVQMESIGKRRLGVGVGGCSFWGGGRGMLLH